MSKELTVKIHSIAEDGLPDMEKLTNRVAFFWDGGILNGWPSTREECENAGFEYGEVWTGAEDRYLGPYGGVTHWVEFPTKIVAIERNLG